MKNPVRFSFAMVLSVCVLGMPPASLSAQEKPSMEGKPFQAKLAALLDDETLCVIHVDFTTIDTDAVLNHAQAFVDRLLDKLALTASDRDSLRASLQLPGTDLRSTWDLGRVRLKAGKALLVDTLGVREAFLVVQTGGKSFPALVWTAIPKHEKLNVTMLNAVLKGNSFLIRETGDFYFIAMIGASMVGHFDLANLGPNRPAARPEFFEAHQAMKDYSVQLLIAPPKYVKKVFRETNPTLPGVFARFDIAAMPGALRWAAIGVNPEKLEFLVVAEAESDSDAQSLYRNSSDLFARASEELISSLRKIKETPRAKNAPVPSGPGKPASTPDSRPPELQPVEVAYPQFVNEDNLKQLGQFLIPKPNGKRFVVIGNGDSLQSVLDKGTLFIRATIEKAIIDHQRR